MSFVGCSSIIYSLEGNSEGAKILDVHAIKQHLKKEGILCSDCDQYHSDW